MLWFAGVFNQRMGGGGNFEISRQKTLHLKLVKKYFKIQKRFLCHNWALKFLP
jgi:hypothetical protein